MHIRTAQRVIVTEAVAVSEIREGRPPHQDPEEGNDFRRARIPQKAAEQVGLGMRSLEIDSALCFPAPAPSRSPGTVGWKRGKGRDSSVAPHGKQSCSREEGC